MGIFGKENKRVDLNKVSLSFGHKADPLKAAIASFPRVFGLRAFPGKVFRIGPSMDDHGPSYVSFPSGELWLYTQVLPGITVSDLRHRGSGQYGSSTESWQDFAKGTPEELRLEIVELEPDQVVEALHVAEMREQRRTVNRGRF